MSPRRCYLLRMRSVAPLALLPLLSGCPSPVDGECMQDPDCDAGEVCGRDGACTSPSSVRPVTITWTVNGAAASMASCAAHPDLYVSYLGNRVGDTLGFAPVPCPIGQFHIDKLPLRFNAVELGVEGRDAATKAITGATVAFDLR